MHILMATGTGRHVRTFAYEHVAHASLLASPAGRQTDRQTDMNSETFYKAREIHCRTDCRCATEMPRSAVV